MGDMGDTFNALREAGREKRASNRETTPAILTEHGVAFQSKNGGAHLVILHGATTADLWPGTGKYMIRGTNSYRRGVFNLLKDLGVKTLDRDKSH